MNIIYGRTGVRYHEVGNGNGNTVTIEECKNKGSASGFDTAVDQECENLICTHPGNNAACVREVRETGQVAVATPVGAACAACFSALGADTISALLFNATQFLQLTTPLTTIEQLCDLLQSGTISLTTFVFILNSVGITGTAASDLITCLRNAGIVFTSDR